MQEFDEIFEQVQKYLIKSVKIFVFMFLILWAFIPLQSNKQFSEKLQQLKCF